MAFTYSRLASTTVGAGGTSAITFSNIPQNYTDLVIKTSVRTNNTGAGYRIAATFNGSTSNFTGRNVYGGGSGAPGSGTQTNVLIGFVDGTTETVNTFSNNDTYIPNYTSANFKSLSTDTVMENNATQAYASLVAGLWSNVTAISSITLSPELGSFVQYSTATLYGIRVEI